MDQFNNEKNQELKKEKTTGIGYRVGQLYGSIIVGCLVAALVALTVKFIFLLF